MMQQYKPGDRIGGEYTVLKVFGGENRSGMGVVYLVENREISEPIVLKTFQHAGSEEAKRQFLSEAHAWIRAGAHSNIVQAYSVREIAGQIFVAAEYVEPDEEGRNNLSHFLSAGQLRIEVILLWAAQFCYGLNYAKSKEILAHRDIKPDNLMIDRAGGLKVTDFGIAKFVDLEAQPQQRGGWFFGKERDVRTISKTMTGSAMGTLPYMAPEQFINSKGVDHRADIYSFGIILYQMAAGNRYPYRIRNDATDVLTEYFHAHAEQSPLPIDSPLMPVISRCLEKQANRRYATYDDLLNDLSVVAKKLRIKLPQDVHVAKEDEELYAQAQSYVALGEKDRVLKAIEEYVAKYPDNECGFTEKGRIHFERGEYAQGLTATRKSLDLNPYNTHAWNNLGILLTRTNAPFAEVRKAFDTALHFDPYNTAAMMNLVGPLTLNKEYGEAAALTARALKLCPDKPLVLQKADVLLKEVLDERQVAAAEELLSAWTEARPSDAAAWHNLGLVFLNNRDLDRAIHCFNKVHELDPQDSFVVAQLAKLYFQKKKARECLNYCDKLLQREHEPLLAVSLKARVLNFIGGYEQALKFLQPFLDHNPKNDTLWVVLAEIHEDRENYDLAIKALQRAKGLVERQNGQHSEENLQFLDQKLGNL
jgi:serine/threonine protein kinase